MKKNGFTLIELLAVIVILAIIALIATPLVLKYIETARKDTFKNSIDAVERAVELKMLQMQTEGKIEYPLELDVKDLDLKNKEKLNGTVTIEKDANNKYTYTYDITDRDYKIYGSKESEVYKLDKTVKLKLKTANGVIDDENNLVYSFYDEGEDRLGYETINMDDYFKAENGTLEFQKNAKGKDSTGSKIILKDKNNNIIKIYTVIIFGDVTADGYITVDDAIDVQNHVQGLFKLNKVEFKAADLNADGFITIDDATIIEHFDGYSCSYSQYTNICTEY